LHAFHIRLEIEENRLFVSHILNNAIKRAIGEWEGGDSTPIAIERLAERIVRKRWGAAFAKGDYKLSSTARYQLVALNALWWRRAGRKRLALQVFPAYFRPSVLPMLTFKTGMTKEDVWKNVFPGRAKRLHKLKLFRTLKQLGIALPPPNNFEANDSHILKIEANMALLLAGSSGLWLATPVGWFSLNTAWTQSLYTALKSLGIRSYPHRRNKRRWTKELEHKLLMRKLGELGDELGA